MMDNKINYKDNKGIDWIVERIFIKRILILSSLIFFSFLLFAPKVSASLNASESQYMITIGPVNGSAVANYAYASIFNPASSNSTVLIRRIYIQSDATAAAAYQVMTVRRISAASIGTQIYAQNITEKNNNSANPNAEIRYAGPTITLSGTVNSRLAAVVAPGAAGSQNGIKLLSFDYTDPIALLPGEGLALYQEAAGSANQKIRLLIEWDEQNITAKPKDEFIITGPNDAVAATANYVYDTLYNPLTSNKTAIVKRISIDIDCSGAAAYTNNLVIRRITNASAGTLTPQADIPKKYSAANNSLMEFRHTGVNVTFAGTADSRISMVTPCGAADQHNGHKEYYFNPGEENIILKQGEGIALYTDAVGSASQLVKFSVEWEEIKNTSTPTPKNDLVISMPRVAVAATTGYVYHSFFNPANSNRTAIIKRVEMRIDAIGAATYQPISLRRINASSGGTLITQSGIPKKQTSTNDSLMELRYQGPTVTYVSKGNGTILNVLGAGAVGQLWSTREFIFYNHENMILQPGEGIAMYSEAAGSANQYAKFSIEWEEEPNSSATPPQNEFIYNIGELTGLATTNYNYTSFFNPANSNITAIIHNIYLGVDSINSAAYRIFDIRRISNASGGVLTNQSDMPKKNTGSNISVMQVRYGNPNVTMLGSSDSRIISVQSSGTTGSAVAPQLSGTQSIQFPGEDLVLRPGEGIVLYNEGAGNVNWKTNLFIVWQEVPYAQTPLPVGENIISLGPVAGSLSANYVFSTVFNPSNSNRYYIFKKIGIRGDRNAGATAPTYIPFSLRKISSASGGTLITKTNVPQKNTNASTTTAELRYGGPSVNFLQSNDSRILGVIQQGAVGQEYGTMEAYFLPDEEYILMPGEGLALYQEQAPGDINMNYRFDMVWNESILDAIPPSIIFNANTTASGNYSQSSIYANAAAYDNRQLGNITIYLYNSTNGLVYNYTSSASPAITNFTNLADGTYYLNATANDSAGNINQTETRVFVLDDTLPQVSFLPDTMASGNYSRTWIYANVSVSDLHFDKVVVRLYNSSGSLINNFTSSSAVFAANFTALSDGTYYLNATANDTFGNSNFSETRVFVLDDTLPQVSFLPDTMASGNYSRTWIYANVSVSDLHFDKVVVRLYNSSGSLINNFTSSSAVFAANFSSLSDGTYYLNATANDTFGNANISEKRTITLDTLVPFVSFVSPTTNNGSYRRNWISVNVTASDTHLSYITILLYNSTGSLISTVNSSLNNLYYNFTSLPDGTYYFNASANDTVGNTNFTATNAVVLDNFNPSISFNPTTTPAGVISQNWIFANITANDPNLYSITVYLYNASYSLISSQNSSSSPFSYNFTSLVDGNYHLNASANDSVGNVNTTNTINITLDTIQPSAFGLLLPANNTVSRNLTPNMSWQQTVDLQFANYTLLVSTDPTFALINFTYVINNISAVSINVSSLNANTKYYWLVIATDSAGNKRNSTQTYQYITDTLSPNVTLNLPANMGTNPAPQVSFNYTPYDANTITSCTLYGNFTGLWGANSTSGTINNNQSNAFTINLTDGTYAWNVLCIDAANNSAMSPGNYTLKIDTTGPLISLLSPSNNYAENSTTNIQFIAVAQDASSINNCSLIINNALAATNYSISNSQNFSFNKSLGNGAYTWSINCTDIFGATSNSTTYNLTVNTPVPPTITLIYPNDLSGDNDGYILVQYNVTDNVAVSNCTLVWQGSVNYTNSSISTSMTNSFSVNTSAYGRYNWSINCTNVFAQKSQSSTRHLDVIMTTMYNGMTTDLSSVNSENIVNLTLERQGYGRIVFTQPINLSGGASLDNIMNIGNNIISVDTVQDSRFNVTAIIRLYSLPYDFAPAIFMNGNICNDCNVIDYTGGNVTFNVAHFTNYTTGNNSGLAIWDDSDPQAGGNLRRIGDNVMFYANYTNKTSGAPILSATCNYTSANISANTSAIMAYNPTTKLYTYNRSFNTTGLINYTITCNMTSSKFEKLSLSDNIQIYSNASMSVTNINPAANINVQQGLMFTYAANITCISGFCGNAIATLDPVNWYDSNWKYRRQIILNVNSGATPQNYQIRLYLNSSNIGANWNWSNECINGTNSRIRFTSSDQATLLPYWVENCNVASSNMTVWVKVDNNITASNYSIYVYYGNAQASGASNGTTTFDFFDDFSGDLSKWTVHSSSGVYPRIENGAMVAGGGITTGTYGFTALGSDATYTSFVNGIIEGVINLSTDAIAEVAFRGNAGANTGYKSRMDARTGQGISHLLPPYSGWGFITGCTVTGTAIATNQWLNFKLVVNGTSFNMTIGGQTLTCNDSTYSAAGEIALMNHYGTSSMYDNIRVRKFSVQEPTYIYGSEDLVGTKGVIPMNNGTPFFTSSNNPMNPSSTACLANMTAGNSCQISWTVNGTGNINTIWNFYVIVNSSGLQAQSSQINITIINDTAPPSIINPLLNATAINQSESISLNVTITDQTSLQWAMATLRYPNGTLTNYSLTYSNNIWQLIFSNTNNTGLYNFTNLIAMDLVGNINTSSYNNLTFNVTLSPPSAFDLISPPNMTESTNLQPNLSWQQTIENNFLNYTLLLSNNINFSTVQFRYYTSNISSTWKIPDYALDANTQYYWKIIAYDVFGTNTSSNQIFSYITDSINPTVDLNNPSDGSTSINSLIIFNYTPHDANTINNCTLYGNFSGTWTSNQTVNNIAKNQQNYMNTTLNDGIYRWSMQCVDKAGNIGWASTNYSLKVDTSPPIINLTGPANGTFENNTNNEVFYVIATDAFSGIDSCKILIDGAVVQTRTGISNGVLFNFTRFVSNGNHTWSVNCTDTNGFESSSAVYNITFNVVDRDAPLITLNYPSSFSYVPASNISFNYTPEDATGINNCSLYIDGAFNKSSANSTVFVSNYFNVTGLSEATHNWTIVCFDNSTLNNRGQSQVYTFTIDLTNPQVALNNPSNNSYTNNPTVTFQYTPSDINLRNCSLYGNFAGGFAYDQINLSPTNNVQNIFQKTLSDNNYIWNILCVDASGRSGYSNANFSINVDTIPPAYSGIISNPSSSANYSSGGSYVFNITWTDNSAVGTVLFESNFTGMFQNVTAQNIGSNHYTVNFSALTAGNYTYIWHAMDIANNYNSTPAYNYLIQQAASIVRLLINNTDANFSINEKTMAIFNASMINPNSGYIELYVGGVMINNGSAPLANQTLFNNPGVYNVTAIYVSTQNYLSSYSTHYLMVNDTTPPNITLLFPANGSIVGTKTVVFQFIVQDASVISNCSLFINGTLNQTSNSITTNQTQTLSADLNDGNYTWTVNCTDSFGNKGNSTLNKFTERQTTNMTISAMTANSSFQQGEPIRITVSTKDLFGNPLLSYTRTAIIYLNTTITKDPWWNGSWPYRKMINITELNNTNLTNYQVNLAINSTALISSGKMNADCSDLRIADDYASEIPYWIESGCNTTSTQVWIKINLSASNSKIVYLYYGNAGAISNANASMVFDYYDSGSQLSNWTVVGTSGQTNAQGMPIPSYYAASASGNYMYRDISLTTNRILEFNVMSDGLGNFYFLTNSTGVGQHFRAETRAANNAGLASATSWTSWAAPTGCSNLATNTWYTVRLVISSTTAQAYINGLACGGAYTFVNSGGYIGLVGDALGVSYTTWWDNLRVRKYVTQEPSSVMSSSEERIIYWYANNTSILDGNISFIFDSSNQYYGNYSVVTVGNSQGFYAAKNYTTFYLGPDTTPPDVVLLTPTDFQRAGVGIYNFSYRPYDYNLNNCTFYININGTFQPLITNTIPTNNATNTFSNISLVLGLYKWNVLCFDILGNNASAPANFTLNLTGPDITLNSTSIWMQGANLVEGTNATILANISNIGLSPAISSFIVQFYAGDPSFNGIQIGSNITIQNLSIGESRTINTSYILKSGNNNIFVIIDSNNQLNESDETNNKANNTFIVELYQYYYGNMTANMVLGTSQDSTLLYISNLSIISGNLYIADSDSMFSFPNLQALGRNVNNVSVSNDFSNLDLNMNTSNYSDSITMVWTNGTNIPISTATFNISYRSVSNVPIVASTNNSNFMTGILWDMADDASHNLRYDTTDKEDIVFVTSFRPATQGKYGTYNYEIKIPATLRSYKGFTNTVSIYYEIN